MLHQKITKIPDNFMNASSVIAYDYDLDGDQDLFVGNLSNPRDFGQTVTSHLLKNDGRGNFTKDLSFELSSRVTSALWKDIDNDGVKDLLISTEWDTPKIYLNNKGMFTPISIPKNLNGLWQQITAYDIDKDGDKDILLGNWGTNTKFAPTEKAPLRMYYSDFDYNGKTETVLAYFKEGDFYPVNSKDELAAQMNVINKRFLNHKAFAKQPISKVLPQSELNNAKVFEVQTLQSGYLENNNGSFDVFKPFDSFLQLAPINSFTEVPNLGLYVSGNSNRVNTYHGAFSSLKGVFMKGNKKQQLASDLGISALNSQVKETFLIKTKNKKYLVIVCNNDKLLMYTFK